MFEAQCVPGIEGHSAMKLAELKRILNLEKVAAVVTIIGFPLVLVSLIFAITLDEHQLKIARSQNNIALNQMLYGDPRNIAIIEAIENKKAIVKTPSGDGQFSSAQLDKYLGDLQTVYDVYKEGTLIGGRALRLIFRLHPRSRGQSGSEGLPEGERKIFQRPAQAVRRCG